jgi:CheY-like chemotaxis protein
MDGYSVARAMRRQSGLEDVFMIALSGYAQPEDLQRAQRAGFNCHLAKPASLEALERLMADSPRRMAAPAASGPLRAEPAHEHSASG